MLNWITYFQSESYKYVILTFLQFTPYVFLRSPITVTVNELKMVAEKNKKHFMSQKYEFTSWVSIKRFLGLLMTDFLLVLQNIKMTNSKWPLKIVKIILYRKSTCWVCNNSKWRVLLLMIKTNRKFSFQDFLIFQFKHTPTLDHFRFWETRDRQNSLFLIL